MHNDTVPHHYNDIVIKFSSYNGIVTILPARLFLTWKDWRSHCNLESCVSAVHALSDNNMVQHVHVRYRNNNNILMINITYDPSEGR